MIQTFRCSCHDPELQFLQLTPSEMVVTKILEAISALEGKEGQKSACGEGNDAHRHTFKGIS